MSIPEDQSRDYTDEIRNFIIDRAKERNHITGSALGFEISQKFPVDIKATYGGIKTFITTYCSEELEWIGKEGGRKDGNDIVALRSSPGLAERPEPATATPSHEYESRNSYWRVFTNPKIKERLILNKFTGDLEIRGDGQEILPEPLMLVEKVTSEEYRQMARAFLPQIEDDTAKSEFIQALSFVDFWPSWSALMSKYRSGIFKAWLTWRDAKVYEIFQERLKAHDVPELITSKSLTTLKESLHWKPSRTSQPKPPRVYTNDTNSELREIVHAAIDKMSDTELKLIWLALGVVSDLIKQDTRNKG